MQCEHDFVLQEERTAPNARHVRAWYAAALVGYFDDHVLVILAVGNDDLVMTKCVVSSEKKMSRRNKVGDFARRQLIVNAVVLAPVERGIKREKRSEETLREETLREETLREETGGLRRASQL